MGAFHPWLLAWLLEFSYGTLVGIYFYSYACVISHSYFMLFNEVSVKRDTHNNKIDPLLTVLADPSSDQQHRGELLGCSLASEGPHGYWFPFGGGWQSDSSDLESCRSLLKPSGLKLATSIVGISC